MNKIVLTGGGTAGHVMPNLALIPELKKHFQQIYYISSETGMENQILEKQTDIKQYKIPTVKFIRKLTFKNLTIPFKLFKSIQEAKKILKTIKPDVVFTKGGYVSVPVAIAAKKLKIPVISHESDLSMGLSNRIIYKYCKVMCVTFKETAQKKDKCVVTGSPIRPTIFNANKKNIYSLCKFKNSNKEILLFFGGSLGAQALNKFVWENLNDLTEKYNILHIVGKNNKNNQIKNFSYYQTEFADNIQDYFDYANYVVCRGGSNSIHELLSLKKLMLIIPLPKAESRGDQIENAKSFKKHGYADYLLQENLSLNKFLEKINSLKINKYYYINNILKSNKQNANKQIVKVILSACEKLKN